MSNSNNKSKKRYHQESIDTASRMSENITPPPSPSLSKKSTPSPSKKSTPSPSKKITKNQSKKSKRWWIEITNEDYLNNKMERTTLLSCTHEDYQDACSDRLPDRWWKEIKRG